MKHQNKAIEIVWWIYILLLFTFVVVKFSASFAGLSQKIIATPFGANYNLIGNVVPFVPLGVLLPIIYSQICSLRKVLIAGVLMIFSIEIFQFFIRLGSFDIDDIILNTVGIAVGYLMLWGYKKMFGKWPNFPLPQTCEMQEVQV